MSLNNSCYLPILLNRDFRQLAGNDHPNLDFISLSQIVEG